MFSRRTMDSLNEVKTKRKLLAINLTDQDKEKSTIPRTSFDEGALQPSPSPIVLAFDFSVDAPTQNMDTVFLVAKTGGAD